MAMKKLMPSAVFLVCSLSAHAQGQSLDVFEQNKRLGKGGNLGNIRYNFETWDKIQ